MVDLNSATEPSEVAATGLGLHARPSPSGEGAPSDTVMRVSRSAQLLLVLDNCDHVLEGPESSSSDCSPSAWGARSCSRRTNRSGSVTSERSRSGRWRCLDLTSAASRRSGSTVVRLLVERARQSAREVRAERTGQGAHGRCGLSCGRAGCPSRSSSPAHGSVWRDSRRMAALGREWRPRSLSRSCDCRRAKRTSCCG